LEGQPVSVGCGGRKIRGKIYTRKAGGNQLRHKPAKKG